MQTTYDQHRLTGYNTLLNQLDDATSTELNWFADETLQQLQTLTPNSREHCHALFDSVDNRWRFAATDVDLYQPHLEPLKQGALN